MGFSLAASSAIIGVAVLISIELIVSTTIPTITEVYESFDEMRDRAVDQVQTDITIDTARWNNPNTEIDVDNTGSVTVNTTNCTIIIDGVTKQFTCSVAFLHPEQSATFYVPGRTDAGEIIKIITPNGVSAYYTY